jgi:hypothetical protein
VSAAWGTLRAQAQVRGLDKLGELMGSFKQPGAFDPLVTKDDRLVALPHLARLDILGQMVRRGLDPVLVHALMPLLEKYPLERALVAWDVLGGSLFVQGDPFVDELRAAARPLAGVLPPPGVRGIDLNRANGVELVRRFSGVDALAEAHILELLGGAYEHKLAAFGELQRRGDELVSDRGVHVSLHSLARLLHLAHLPSLASVYFDYLSRELGYRPAAMSLGETLLDAEVPRHLPADLLKAGDLPDQQLEDAGLYLVCRAYLAFGQTAPAYALVERNRQARPAEAPPPSPQLVVLRAHLSMQMSKPPGVTLEALDRVCEKNELWRYAARVRVAATATLAGVGSRAPLDKLHDFIISFGNDRRCWHEALDNAPPSALWKRDAARVLGRELLYLPHERACWEVLSMFVGSPRQVQEVVDEIDARLNAQAQL